MDLGLILIGMGIDGPKEDLGGEARSETPYPSAYPVSMGAWRSDVWLVI